MQFTEEHIEKIESGEKTQTRRVWDDGAKVNEGGVYIADPDVFCSHEDAECYIRVTDMRRQRLGDMVPGEAQAEGYESLEAFREAWKDINGDGSWDDRQEVTEYVGSEKPEEE